MTNRSQSRIGLVLLLLVMLAGSYFRFSGLFRGLDRNSIYHPDSPKQVMMLYNYLHGNYLQYYDSLFYDGYPYGLNRLDEAVIRATLLVTRPIGRIVHPNTFEPHVPTRTDLYYWGRVLRVIYGLVTVILIYFALLRFGTKRWIALAAASFYSLAPLGVTVAHSVTGDIGVDLFVAVSLWCLAGYPSTGRSGWLLASAAACGVAFSCKYQGALGIWMTGLTTLLAACASEKRISTVIRVASASIPLFVIGFVAGTPALLVDPEKAWKFIRKNFAFIKDYGVSAEFLAQPLHQKAAFGLSHNIPVALSSLGWFLSLLSLLSLIGAFMAWRRSRTDAGSHRLAAAYVAIASFPPIALLLSAGLKPEVQPFHFSFLLPVMAVGAALLLHQSTRAGKPILGLAVAVLAIAAIAESARTAVREDFFWRRPEIASLAVDYSNAIFEQSGYASKKFRGQSIIKRLYVEPSTLPVFRNRPSGIQHPDADWWREQHILPVPAIPLRNAGRWVFMNGPVFPRSDRMFAVPASGPGMVDRPDNSPAPAATPLVVVTEGSKGRWTQRTLVYERDPKTIVLGLRSGRWPSRYSVCASGRELHGFLPPHSQRVITIDSPKCARRFADGHGDFETYLVPLAMRSELGPIWVTVLEQESERTVFNEFGPSDAEAENLAPVTSLSHDELDAALSALKFMRGTNCFALTSEPTRLPGEAAPLPAGRYVFNALVVNTSETGRITISLDDASGLVHETAPFVGEASPGLSSIEWRFEKSFAPYDGLFLISSSNAGLSVLSWSIKPDAASAFMPRRASPDKPAADLVKHPVGVHYPGIGTIEGITLPNTFVRGQQASYMVAITLDENISHRVFHEAVLFLQLRDDAGRVVASLDYPLSETVMRPGLQNLQHIVIPADSIAAGTYALDGGIYNARTRLRFAFDKPTDNRFSDAKRRYFRWADIPVK